MTTESKVFSIYATGIVKAGKRETRSRAHAIIDYRGAPPPPEAIPLNQQGTGGAPGTGAPQLTGTGGTQASPTGSGGTENAIPGATRPNPAGNVVYFRLD
jgi:hypothetical protein